MAKKGKEIQSEFDLDDSNNDRATTGDSKAIGGASTEKLASGDDSGGVDDGTEAAAVQPSVVSESGERDFSTAEAVVSYKPEQVVASWFGLTLSHRRLMDALQNGWLPPRSEVPGHLLGACVLVKEPGELEKHTILVRLYFDVSRLPNIRSHVFREGAWISASPTETGPKEEVWFWPGVLPTSAITRLAVSTAEERIRLIGIADQLSNVALPVDVQIVQVDDVMRDPLPNWPPPLAPTDLQTQIKIPAGMDATHGAMAMAVWSVPRIDPWLDVLVASLSDDRERLVESATRVAAPWWREPPWTRGQGLGNSVKESTPKPVLDGQDALWRAAIDVLGDGAEGTGKNPRDLADLIADTASDAEPDGMSGISEWLVDMHQVLRAKTTIRPDRWADFPVGLAIQLVLTRLEPFKFKTWLRELPNLPPRVWWSAATLCGWGNGYKKLDTCFRGEPTLQEALSVLALRVSSTDRHELAWPSMEGKPGWRKSKDGFDLLLGKVSIARKAGTARSRWYAADFSDERIRQEAFRVAMDLGWPCGHRRIRLPSESRVIVKGSYVMEVGEGKHATEIRGKMDIQLPSYTEVEEVLDEDAFREHVAKEIGKIPEPPVPNTSDVPVRVAEESLKGETLVPGLKYVPGFLNEAEEAKITRKIDEDRVNWSNELKRRVQHYGWRYDYKAGQIDRRDRIGPLPDWAAKIARRLVDQGLVPEEPDQLIVNEYLGKQGIAKHIDSMASFDDHIAMISLLESWEMVFRRGQERLPIRLERGSATVMSGPSRTQWTHEIPARQYEPGPMMPYGRKKGVPRVRRLSLTFRRVAGTF